MESGSMISAVTGALSGFSVTALGEVITAGLGLAVPLVVGWFTFRWIYKKIKGSFKQGA